MATIKPIATKNKLIKKIKIGGLRNEAQRVLDELKVRGTQCMTRMGAQDLSEEDRGSYERILGGIVVQTSMIELVIEQGGMALEHKELVVNALSTVAEIDAVFN